MIYKLRTYQWLIIGICVITLIAVEWKDAQSANVQHTNYAMGVLQNDYG